MISSVSDYLFVTGADIDTDHPHGDLDRIIIDGGVMPLRTGTSATTGVANSKILRGEDIAFLMEATRERQDVVGQTVATQTFTRKVEYTRPYNTCSQLKAAALLYLSGLPTEQWSCSSDPVIPYRSASDLSCDETNFGYGSKLQQSCVNAIFEDLKLLTVTRRLMKCNTRATRTLADETDFDADYPPNFSSPIDSRGKHIAFESLSGVQASSSHQQAYGGKVWYYRPLTSSAAFTISFTFPIAVSAVEFWADAYALTYESGESQVETSYRDLVKIADGTSSDLLTWSTPFGYTEMKTLATRVLAQHQSRGEIVNVPEYVYPSISSANNYSYSSGLRFNKIYAFVTLGDHTKWW